MELKRETICEDTLKFVQEYYRLNTEPLFSILADDCVWMGTGNVLASGAAAMADVSYSQKLTADVASLLTGSSGGIFP